MRKLIATVSILVFFGVLILGGMIVAAPDDTAIRIYVDDEEILLEDEVILVDGRTLVPIRGVFEELGIIVDYNQETHQVIAKIDGQEILMDIGEDKVLVDGQIRTLDVGTQLIDNRTYIPIRFVTEASGYKVDWDGLTKSVSINTEERAEITSGDTLPRLKSKSDMFALLSYNTKVYNYMFGIGMGSEVMFTAKDSTADSMPAEAEDNGSVMQEEVAAGDYSDTNVQVAGVSESDVIKTDGEYIYKVKDNQVLIILADEENSKVVNTISLDDQYITEIFLENDRLVLYGNNYNYWIEPMVPEVTENEDAYYYNFYEEKTFIKVYNVEDVNDVSVIGDYSVDGYYVSSRVVDNTLYMITNKGILFDIYTYEKDGQEFRESINDEWVLPSYIDYKTGEEEFIDYDQIAYFPGNVQSTYMLTTAIDLSSDDADIEVEAYLGSASNIYVSQDNLYVAVPKYEYNETESSAKMYMPIYETNTVIYKFSLAQGSLQYEAQGQVEGQIVNQFSMDEFEENFRIATTINGNWFDSGESTNNVYILDNELEEIGALEDLAKGERIYSTRFAGDKIYMVTFKQVDPFFVIDASEPTKPAVLGYLKIPGFSTYMHIVDDNHILGFGSETSETEDGRVITEGFKISLFNVEDFGNPYEQEKLVIGESGTWSELSNNHKALMYSLSKNVMAVPIQVCENELYETDFIGGYIFDITNDSVQTRGRITHHDNTTIEKKEGYKWFDYNYNIERMIYIGDSLYSFSPAEMHIHDLETLDKLGEIKLY